MKKLLDFLSDSTGATAVEYGILAGLISAALIVGLGGFGGALQNTFNTLSVAIAPN
ncbi:Flp family type IVb pilin [Rhizobium sp. FY34]|uniref:Flp family type IVb pilin n=1 Tax=Rhizobium sp. FY34 TaxID=2562309 RepID=UPI0010C10E86|nr:Flp family type IVb pilin [Rhizobium sp. FY34]